MLHIPPISNRPRHLTQQEEWVQNLHLQVVVPTTAQLPIITEQPLALQRLQQVWHLIGELQQQIATGDAMAAWRCLHRLGCYWQQQLLIQRASPAGFTTGMRVLLRDQVLAMLWYERQTRSQLNFKNYDPRRVAAAVAQRIKQHPLQRHQLLGQMQQQQLSLAAIETLLRSLLLLQLRLASSTGWGELQALINTKQLARCFRSLGVPYAITPKLSALRLLNQQYYVLDVARDPDQIAGWCNTWALLQSLWAEAIYKCLRRSGIPKQDLSYWQLARQFQQKAEVAWYQDLLRRAQQPTAAARYWQSAERLLTAANALFDEISEATTQNPSK